MSHQTRQLPLDIRLREDATFDGYIGRASEQLRQLDSVTYLWGERGSGLSHLLQAICHAANGRHEQSLYLSSLAQYSPALLDDLDGLDVVCIDDVDEVAGQDAWEVALFHLINGVRDRGGRVVLSAHLAVNQLPVVLKDLQSRLIAASCVESDHLNDDQKVLLLQQKARRQGFMLGEEVARFILERSARDMHRLLTLFAQLEVETLRQHRIVTIPFVKQTLHL